MRRIWNIRKSLIAQLGFISVVFVILAVLQIFISPAFTEDYWGTVAHNEHELSMALELEAQANPDDLDRLKTIAMLQKIAAQNPNFRLYAETSTATVSFGGAPQKETNPDFAILFSAPFFSNNETQRGDFDQECSDNSYVSLFFEENDYSGRATYFGCSQTIRYIEVAGFDTPVLSGFDAVRLRIERFKIEQWRQYLAVAVGVLIIGLITIYRSAASVRKVARITDQVDINQRGESLSRDGLPLEIYPLVDSLNDMLTRLYDVREKQKFFVATAAHELRTPLTILRARLEQLPQSNHRDALQDDLRRLSRLVEQLLHLTAVRSKEMLDLEPVNLEKIVRDVCADRALLAIASGLDLELKVNATDTNVVGNVALISTAVSNLIDNAISMSDAGQSILVSVSDPAIVCVKDQGPGIPPEKRGLIFEPFAKFPPNRNGHGLGLAIVQAVMQIHSGHARVVDSSDADRGATFELAFNRDAT